jgi:sporulation protein YlmC with PRC-barrel domain
MKKLITTFFALIAMLALVSPLYAADDYRTGTSFLSAEEIEGMKVVSQTGEEIGEIESVKVDHQSGEIKFVSISTGIGEETAVPFEAIRFDQHNERATLTVNENKLDNAPEQANMSDDEFQQSGKSLRYSSCLGGIGSN